MNDALGLAAPLEPATTQTLDVARLELSGLTGRRPKLSEAGWLWLTVVTGEGDPFMLPHVQRLLVAAPVVRAHGVASWVVSRAPLETLRRGAAKFSPAFEVLRDASGSALGALAPWLHGCAAPPASAGVTLLVDAHGVVVLAQRDAAAGPWLKAADVLLRAGAWRA